MNRIDELEDLIRVFHLSQVEPKNKMEWQIAHRNCQIVNNFIENNFPEEISFYCKNNDFFDFGEYKNAISDFYGFLEFLKSKL